jgi:CheY-like chemotaxis protein
MVRLVDDLLDVSRITRGKVELRKEHVALNGVLAKAIEMVRPLVDSRSQTVQIDARVSDAFVDGDPARLAQVFANVLTNSAKYSNPQTEIRIVIASEGDRAVVRVADRGSGIAPDLLPMVFEPFVQGPQSLDRSRGGLGLGLAIVKNLVELHGGTVEVTSEGKGLGAEVTIRLPLAHQEAEVVPPPPSSQGPSGTPLHVLVVDDNEDAVALLVEVLGAMGHRVDVSYDGVAALDAIVRGTHDVVLLDIGLPGLDGYEVARRVRQAGRPVRLVALTGYGRDNDKQMTRAAGFDAHLVKPVDFRKLAAALRASA